MLDNAHATEASSTQCNSDVEVRKTRVLDLHPADKAGTSPSITQTNGGETLIRNLQRHDAKKITINCAVLYV